MTSTEEKEVHVVENLEFTLQSNAFRTPAEVQGGMKQSKREEYKTGQKMKLGVLKECWVAR